DAAAATLVLEVSCLAPREDDHLLAARDERMPERPTDESGSAAEDHTHSYRMPDLRSSSHPFGANRAVPFDWASLCAISKKGSRETAKGPGRKEDQGRTMRPRFLPPILALWLGLLPACGPRSVAEAEAKQDVNWLSQNASGDSVAALGRLADHNPQA